LRKGFTKGFTKAILAAGSSLASLVGVGWLGLRVKPAPFPPHPAKTPALMTAELPAELPEPVRRHFRATLGGRVPRIDSAVVWGRADFKVGGLWTPMRFKGYYVPGREFRRDMEITWFGIPILQGSDAYLKGEGSLEITGLLNTSSKGENLDQGQNLAMWAEAPFTTPSVLVLDPRARWEPMDAASERLIATRTWQSGWTKGEPTASSGSRALSTTWTSPRKCLSVRPQTLRAPVHLSLRMEVMSAREATSRVTSHKSYNIKSVT
jgi:hypothetical protein